MVRSEVGEGAHDEEGHVIKVIPRLDNEILEGKAPQGFVKMEDFEFAFEKWLTGHRNEQYFVSRDDEVAFWKALQKDAPSFSQQIGLDARIRGASSGSATP